jgi:hypothetical protein
MSIVDADLDKADLALLELPRARMAPFDQGLAILRHLSIATRNNGSRNVQIENAQASAWLKICRLRSELEMTKRCPDDDLWDDATELTNQWKSLLT